MVQPDSNLILVCGLGDVGQNCVSLLHDAGIDIAGIDSSNQALSLAEQVSTCLKQFVIGDMRQVTTLERAGLTAARAVLLVTGNDDVNLQTALIILAITPEKRVVLRSSRGRLNHLLHQQFPNLVILDPTPLVAQIVALSLLDAQLLGSFSYQDYSFELRLRSVSQITQLPLTHQEGWISGDRRAIGYWRSLQQGSKAELIASSLEPLTLDRGDFICEVLGFEPQREASFHSLADISRRSTSFFRPRLLLDRLNALLQQAFEGYTARLFFVLLIIMVSLVVVTQVAFSSLLPKLPAFDRLIYGILLLLGNFSDLLGPLQEQYHSPQGLLLLSVVLTVTGTALVGVFYALFTDALMSRRLPFTQGGRRPPRRPNFLIWGQDELAIEVYHKLKSLRQRPLLVANLQGSTPVPDLPLIEERRLLSTRAELWSSLRGMAALKSDELINLEAILEVREQLPQLRCTLATHKSFLHEHINAVIESIRVVNVAHVAASAFTSAALGEHVISAIHFQSLTLLVMVYNLETQPNLGGLLVSDLIWGFLTLPLLYLPDDQGPILLPRDEIRLKASGSLLVLTSQEGILRVEQSRPIQPCWQLWVDSQPNADAAFEGTRSLVQATGCPLSLASSYLKCDPPGLFTQLLYLGPALRLNQRLQRLGIRSQLKMQQKG
jgi:Trk K+ transport system NAD-binding subunit